MQYACAEGTVLALLAPDTRRQIHQWCKRTICSTQRPDSGEFPRINAYALAHQSNGAGNVASFLDRRLNARAQRICFRIVMSPQRAVLHVDRLRQISREREETISRHVV